MKSVGLAIHALDAGRQVLERDRTGRGSPAADESLNDLLFDGLV
jgi:hypothetical protein